MADPSVNPVTKLWEFYDLRSAWDGTSDPRAIAVPQHRPDGSFEVDAGTGVVFVLLPGGIFTMGAQSMDPSGPNHEPFSNPDEAPHELGLEPFLLARHELTKAQWERFAGAQETGWTLGVSYSGDATPILASHPADLMDWDTAVRWLQRHGMNLPTEAQWEYGARAGTKTPWWPGSRAEDLQGCANVHDRSSFQRSPQLGQPTPIDDGFRAIAPVGSFRANPFGLFDVHGNVWEWCMDGYGPYGTQRDGDGLRTDGARHTRVIRGGGYSDGAHRGRSAARNLFSSTVRNGYLGLRVARSLE